MAGPVFTSTAPTTATQGTLFTYQPTATDASATITSWSISNAPTGSFFSTATGAFSWTPPFYAQTSTFVIRVTDSTALFTDQTVVLAVGQNLSSPSLSSMTKRNNEWVTASNGLPVGLKQNIPF